MARKLPVILLIILLSLLASGCWSRMELNELGIVMMQGIDKTETGYKVSVQFINPAEIASQKGGGGRSAVTTYDQTGSTIFQAVRRMSQVAPRTLYFSQLKILVIGEDLAREGIGEPLDVFYRNHEVRTNFYIIIAKHGKAEKILDILTPVEKIPAVELFTKLQHTDQLFAATSTIKLDELIKRLTGNGKEAAVTGIELMGNAAKGNTQDNVKTARPLALLQYSGMAVFHKDRLVGWLNEYESKGYNYVQSKGVQTTAVIVPYDDGKVSIELKNERAKITGKLERGTPVFHIDVKAEANIAEVTCKNMNLKEIATINQLQELAESDISKRIRKALKKAKGYKSDIFGLGQTLYQSNPKIWHEVKKEWNTKYFPKSEVTVSVHVKIRNTGTKGNSFLNELE